MFKNALNRIQKFPFIGTLCLAALVLSLIPTALSGEQIAKTLWTALYILTLFGFSASLLFEGCVRYSQYGLSQNHTFFNHAFSIAAIAMPILAVIGIGFQVIWGGGIPVLLSLLLIGYSKYRSPNRAEETSLPWFKRPFIIEIMNAGLLLMLLLLLLIF